MSISEPNFGGTIGATYRDSTPWWPDAPRALGGPNVVLVVLDDTGFAHFGCYGSLIDTPNIDRLARGGVLYNSFHTTALCSPSRASMLTGRNHHSVGMRAISNWNSGFPNMRGSIAPSAATVAQVLNADGYATFALGKWHLAPMEEASAAGPFHNWPLQKGFDRFYGFMNGETDQFYPELAEDNHPVDPPRTPEEGYHLSEDLVDRAVQWISDLKGMIPDQPFFTYLAFGAQHAPHHAPDSYLAKWRGAFDEGYDVLRERVYQRQLELGVIPAGTALAPRNPGVPAWDDLTENQKRFSTRLQEAFAAMLEHTDAQIGRLVDYLESIGEMDNTLFMVCSDNGASQEGGPYGVMNEFSYFNMLIDDVDDVVATRLDDIGTPRGYSNYPWGWAQVGNTPLKWYKQNTYGGGVRDPLVVHYPKGIRDRGAIRPQFCHAVDLTPTILEVTGATMPDTFAGVAQLPLHGASLVGTFAANEAPAPRSVQYFEQLGHRGIYADGWKLTTYHVQGRPWDEDVWGLFRLDDDFSECNDLSAKFPEKYDEMLALWWSEAERYGVLPLDDRGIELFAAPPRPGTVHARTTYTYHPPVARIPMETAPALGGRSWVVTADVDVPAGGVEGVLFARGGHDLGVGVFVRNNELHFNYNALGRETRISGPFTAGPGAHVVVVEFERVGKKDANVTLRLDDTVVATGYIPQIVRIMGSSGMTIGYDSHSPMVTDYELPFAFTGSISKIVFDVKNRAAASDTAATQRAEMGKE